MAKAKIAVFGLMAAGLLLSACAVVETQPSRTTPGATTQGGTQTPIASSLAPKERLVKAIEGESCLLRSDNVAKILLRANLTQDELMKITPELAREGRAEVQGSGTIRVITPACA